MRLFGIVVLLILLAVAPFARADEFVSTTPDNLAKLLVRFNAIDINDDRIIDEYTAVTDCNLYKSFFRDDFKWNKVRDAVRIDISKNIASFPIGLAYVSKLELDRYDFKEKLYRFSERATVRNVNAFLVSRTDGTTCGSVPVHFLPNAYRAVLDVPIYILGLPLTSEDAQALLRRLDYARKITEENLMKRDLDAKKHTEDRDERNQRAIYARFNLRVAYIDPLRKYYEPNSTEMLYVQGNHSHSDPVQIDVRLDSVDFFENKALTQLIYTYRP